MDLNNYCCFIPFVNRRDFLDRAIDSLLYKGEEKLVIIDNSDTSELGSNYRNIFVYTPSVPLSFSQSMNLIQKISLEKKLDYYVWMHSDAFVKKETVERLFDKVKESFAIESKWAVIFTFYDCLSACNVASIEEVGEWDTAFPQYFADNDFYRRVFLKGYTCLESGAEGVEHSASATVKNDPKRWYENQAMYQAYRHLYFTKWGGYPNSETYIKPYNKLDL